MTADAALKEIARQERRFEKLGFKNGLMLAKSYPPAEGCPEGAAMGGARDYYAEMLEWQGKVAAAAKSHKCPPPVKPTIKIQLSPDRVIEAHWEEYVFVDDQRISVREFIQNFVEAVTKVASDEQELREKWSTPDSRQELLESLKEYGYSPDRLKDVQKMLEREDCDILDIMLNLVYSEEALTRTWRVKHMESELAKLNPARRAFAEVVLQKYVTSGVWVLSRATLHDYHKIKFGTIAEATPKLGYSDPLEVVGLYDDLQRKLYSVSVAKVAV